MLSQKVKILLVTSRPIFWLGPIFIYLLGIIAANVSVSFLVLWGFIFVTFPMGIIVYGLNDITDRESDRMNKRKGGVEGGLITENNVVFLLTVIVLLSIVSLLPYILLNQVISTVPIILIIIFAYFYSFEPFKFKSKPFLDSASNALWMLLIFLLGFSLSANKVNDLLYFPANIWFIVMGVFAVHALTTLLDYDVDKKIGDKTIGGLLGIKMTALLCCLLFLAILAFLKVQNVIFTVYLILSALLCGVIIIRPHKKLIHLAVWIVLLTFPVACLYTFLFDKTYLKTFLGN